MTLKPQFPHEESGRSNAPVLPVTKPPSDPEDPASVTEPLVLKPRTRKKAPRVPPSVQATGKADRDTLLTVADRLMALPQLPSLEKFPSQFELKTVDADASPPPVPAPPVEEPSAGPSDRGLPVPAHYNMDRLVVLVRDACWLYVYWELKGGALDRLRFAHSAEVIDNSRWVLRVRNLAELNQRLIDVDIRTGQWYLKVSPGTHFAMELGFINQQGEFVLVLKGNEVSTPRLGISPVVDEHWMILREDLEKLLHVSGGSATGVMLNQGASENAPRAMRSVQPRAQGLISARSTSSPL